MRKPLDSQYWTDRYRNNQTGWDTGSITLPLKQYLDQLENKSSAILIPGAGNAYEAAYAYHSGFENVHILDVSPIPLDNFIRKYPYFPTSHIHQEDFFSHSKKYDLVLEQTFFCSLMPIQRRNYAKIMNKIIKPGGKLVGVLFDKDFGKEGPPFGGNKEEYEECFKDYFNIEIMEPCYNSIAPRQGHELFIKLINNA